ncbi:AAA family ATPase [Corallococcus aberystwythensis]|uniref:AAA family ATPase n=1 Tax=Corallococcus aberystwythensis TaxID=2316722 RepID=UPI0011C4A190|nr:AAA family ATPase [Corallococcus aberystwythensis]
MRLGFILKKLALTGQGATSAELSFARGLNVISGPSDTGKTFIAQCIDFILGGGSLPETIPEAAPYTSIHLTIESNQQTYKLERSLRGGNILLRTEDDLVTTLKAKHKAGDNNTISSFLLELSGLNNKRIRTNQQGKTRQLSFRDIAPLILIDEESVIAKSSPVLSGQFTTRTAEVSTFRLLLTGIDDSSVIAEEDSGNAKVRQEGKVEVLDELLQRTRSQFEEMKLPENATELRGQLDRLIASTASATAELSLEQQNVSVLEVRRRTAWSNLRQAESRNDVLSELQKRFELLRAQYSSDLRRLDAIAEAGLMLGLMKEEHCPVCGASSEHHDRQHQHAQSSPTDVAQACRAEAAKTNLLLGDLQTTLTANALEIDKLTTDQNTYKADLEAHDAELKTMMQPRLQAAAQKIKDNQAIGETLRRGLDLLERTQELEALLAPPAAPQRVDRIAASPANVTSGEAEMLSKDIENLLRSWHFPTLDRVTFSETAQDIVISGQPRGSHGKGVRAITRAAFNLALLKFCLRESRPFPGFVLIDSPLVVYREPDANEGSFPIDVKNSFYQSISDEFKDSQVIILENDEPPDTVRATANIIAFTGTGNGRRGFIPET